MIFYYVVSRNHIEILPIIMFLNVQGLDLFEDECGEGGAYSYDNLYLAGWCLSKQLEVISNPVFVFLGVT